MKFITKGADGAIRLVAYENYLNTARDRLAARVDGADRLLHIDRFGLGGPGTLHDSRLVSLEG